ncbi:Uma2 family endonuclease [Planctomicrobium sp. SH661]|uniref:Uma2 family endonuclease n=1 Tax=Planctomicrobium sp. SH661 TaxID=3448124 RepID=UPI003F5BF0AD
MVTLTRYITAEEYGQMPRSGTVTELVRGEIVDFNQSFPRQGQVCAAVSYALSRHLESAQLGHVVVNSGILTSRNPDTVRCGDVWYVSYRKVPRGPLPKGYLDVSPDIVFEVKSPGDRWGQILAKVAEYLDLDVGVVCVLDPEEEMVRLYYADRPEVILAGEDPVTFPEQLPGFEVQAQKFFQ